MTTSSNFLSACELNDILLCGNLSLEESFADSKKRIVQREPEIAAWKFLDWSVMQEKIDALHAIPKDSRGPLWGVPVALKDIFDTIDMPTAYGSSIYEGHIPVADAACVARLRAAGALLIGKSVSTEFAFWKQGSTRNPLNPAHTPGGSSSGSAAAVADFMVPLALGSQTAASTVRPAAYCGIVGFKPTFGLVSTAGVKALAGSMDTVGLFARSVADIRLLLDVLIGAAESDTAVVDLPEKLRFQICNEGELDYASESCLAYFEECQSLIQSLGGVINAPLQKPNCRALYEIQTDLMAFEASRELAFEYHHHNDKLSDVLKQFLQEGLKLNETDWHAAQNIRSDCLASLDDYFGDAEILLMPSTTDTAPLYEDGTGEPVMSRAWTLLGLPSISLPLLSAAESSGAPSLPFGIQLAARPGQDRLLLAVAEHLMRSSATGQSNRRP